LRNLLSLCIAFTIQTARRLRKENEVVVRLVRLVREMREKVGKNVGNRDACRPYKEKAGLTSAAKNGSGPTYSCKVRLDYE
jgi:hypothetical protein